jgi:aminomethyltransferase
MTAHAAQDIAPAARASPFHDATERYGCRAYGVYNGLRIPLAYGRAEQEYWTRSRAVVLCDASADLHVELSGPDAHAFAQWLTPTSLAALRPGHCKQALLVDEQGGVVATPMALCLDAQRVWLAEDHSDLLPWVKGVALNCELDVRLSAPPVATLALEGPAAAATLHSLLGAAALPLGAYEVREVELDGMTLVISARAGMHVPAYSLRLHDADHADALWERVMAAGQAHGIGAAAHSLVHRLEAGWPALGSEVDAECDPYEAGLGCLVDAEPVAACIGAAALGAIKARGPRRRLVGVHIGGAPMPVPDLQWCALLGDGEPVGELRSAVFSPRLRRNIGLAMVLLAYAEPGVRLSARFPDGERACVVSPLPFAVPQAG